MTRHLLVDVSELLDRLSINLIKQVCNDRHATSYSEAIAEIVADLDLLPTLRATPLSGRLVRLLVALAQINLHIWRAKDDMLAYSDRFAGAMTVAHRLNAIRNQLKVSVRLEVEGSGFLGLSTNTVREEFDGWVFSVLDSPAPVLAPPAESGQRFVHFTLADLIDRVTISQIKETLFTGERMNFFTRDLVQVAADIDYVLSTRPVVLSGGLIRLIMLIAQCNLHVWMAKDRMEKEPDSYVSLLARAQELNGLRNNSRNCLMTVFGELTPAARRSTFLDEGGGRWYSPIIQ